MAPSSAPKVSTIPIHTHTSDQQTSASEFIDLSPGNPHKIQNQHVQREAMVKEKWPAPQSLI